MQFLYKGIIPIILSLIVSFPQLILGADHQTKPKPPNFVFILIDDLGWGDFSCFENPEASTPNIDSIASEGIQFRQFYVNSPICSPSRVAVSTGRYPFRYGISSYLDNRKRNEERGMANWLDPEAPMLARSLKSHGYATGHFGKWHMGGQRDVTDAPAITSYGFDESLTNFEGLGPKLLPMTEALNKDGEIVKGKIWHNAETLGDGYEWTLRSSITGGFVDRAVDFIDRAQAQEKPFYVNVWPDDVHTPLFPSVENWSEDLHERYMSVLEEMDAQFKPLFDRIRNDPQLKNNTILVICSDNGPELNCGLTGPFRGIKATLYEGGIRSPLVVWAPGFMPAKAIGSTNHKSVICGMDLVPSILEIAGVEAPEDDAFDGEPLADIFLGRSQESRKEPIYFQRPPDRKNFRTFKNLPDLAMREGKWKLLCDFDGSRRALYDLSSDPAESNNLADQHPARAEKMANKLLSWNQSIRNEAKTGPRSASSRLPQTDPTL